MRHKERDPTVKPAATRLAGGEFFVSATNSEPRAALANHRRRGTIETHFTADRYLDFKLEAKHALPAEGIAKLMAVLATALAIPYAIGQWCAKPADRAGGGATG